MRIDAAALVADGLRYQKSLEDGRAHFVRLGRSGGVTGFYAHERSREIDAEAVSFEIVEAAWQLVSGHIKVGAPARLEGVKLVLSIPAGDAPTTLQLGVTRADLGSAELRSGTTDVVTAAEVSGIAVARTADGSLAVAAAKARLRDTRLTVAGVSVQIAEAHVEGLSVTDGTAGRTIKVASVDLRGVELDIGSTKLGLSRVRLRDALWRDERFEAREIDLGEVELGYTFSKPKTEPGTHEAPSGERKPLPDIAALDRLEGHVAFQVNVEGAVPLIKNRVMNHAFKIPISNGALSFGDLERSLSLLEDAILDFEVEEDELILELDVVPVVKLDNVTLVSWSLADPDDKALAKQERVRLRKLLQYHLPPARPRKRPGSLEKKGAFRLVGVAFEWIDIALDLGGPVEIPVGGGKLRLGGDDRAALESLTARGTIHLPIEEAPKAGHLNLALGRLHASVEGISIGSARIVRATVEADGIDPVRADFSGTSPHAIGARIPSARIRDLAIERVGSSNRG